MFLSICVPTYNRRNTLERNLKSIESQKFSDLEVLVIDDGSTDNTEEFVKNYLKDSKMDIRFFKKENGGKHTALNLGISEARGKFFMILDSDDWLVKDSLTKIYEYCKAIEDDDKYCGIAGKSMLENKKILGSKFPEEPFISSYIDFHFFAPAKYGSFGDCCECNKTSILKAYRFPEDKTTKFVPEAFIFDQIGTKYKLLCTNDIYMYKEYMKNGISSTTNYKSKNIVGFLYHYISRIENILPYIEQNSLKLKVIAWWRYWDAVKQDVKREGPRIKKVTFLGYLVYVIRPIIDKVYKYKYPDMVIKGR